MTTHNLTPGSRRRASLLLTAAVLLLTGCTHIAVDFQSKSASVTRFLSDTALETATYESPDGTKVIIGGYSSTTKVESLIKLLEAVK